MASRREFLGTGLSAVALGFLGRRVYADPTPCIGTGAAALRKTDPVFRVKPGAFTVDFEGIPFERVWTGDRLPHPSFGALHKPPTPTEFVDVVVVGGGLSGLTSAYLLRDLNPVVLEYNHRFGGAAQGEMWGDALYPIGSAYVISPDKGSFLEGLYADLGMDTAHRYQPGTEGDATDPVVLGGQLLFDFWTGAGKSPQNAALYQQFALVVENIANNLYPDIPIPDNGPLPQFIHDMDTRTFKEDIEMRLGAPMPTLLAAGVQAYCYSSFGAGCEEISAVGGWNFLAAEEFGRWVLPGGNSFIVRELWRRLAEQSRNLGLCMLRAESKVFDIRLTDGGALVTYESPDGAHHTIHAHKVVVSCPKYVAKYMLPDLPNVDSDKLDALDAMQYRAYVVANILFNTPMDQNLYDIFLLGDGNFPTNGNEAMERDRVIDMLNGVYAQPDLAKKGVLTLYFPLPWDSARFSLITNTSWHDYATTLAPQINQMLDILGFTVDQIERVRLTRWGHAMPRHMPGFINSGLLDRVRRPVADTIYFVEQDNWALPAVENCLIDANIYTQILRDHL